MIRPENVIDLDIHFLIVVPDAQTSITTPLQGFSLSLCENYGLIRLASFLPSNILDLTEDGIETNLIRKICGLNPVHWYPQSADTLRDRFWPAFMPFSFILFGKEIDARDFRKWAEASDISPTLVAESGGDIAYKDLTEDGLKKRLLQICEKIEEKVGPNQAREIWSIISGWKSPPERKLDYKVGGHGSVSPNLMALSVAGYVDLVDGPFKKLDEGNKPYIEQIVATSKTIFAERKNVGEKDAYRTFPKTPDLNLFAPAIYSEFFSQPIPDGFDVSEKKIFRTACEILKKQSGYAFELKSDNEIEAVVGQDSATLHAGGANPKPHMLMLIRQREIALNVEAVAALAASEFSAVIRLPNEINRTSGTIRQFAEHYRSNQPQSRKRLRAFREAQIRLAQGFPQEFVEFVRQSESGIRIIADAHLEWLDLDGLPLILQKNVSRLPVTPGNLFIENIVAKPMLRLLSEDFKKVLVISALKRDDPIRPFFEVAFTQFGREWSDTLEVQFAEVSNEKELIDALNNFDGPLVIFDGHGSHDVGAPAHLHLMDEAVDVWFLRGKLERPPPIVILSACDTHAADRNHATTANGFLALGARAVLGSVFPLSAFHAASFTARLVYRIAKFIPPAVGMFGRALTWTEVVSGMLRMQFLTDFLRDLQAKELISEEVCLDVHLKGNMAINAEHDAPFDEVIGMLVRGGLDEKVARAELQMSLAHSEVLSYLNLGRPETILLDTREQAEKRLAFLLE